jgi:GDPmannose 4,6-dehydratase
MATALIVGSAGQDGSLLAAHLRARDYTVHGIDVGTGPSLDDAAALADHITALAPDEIYYLAAYHHSSEDPPVEPVELFRRSLAVQVTGLVHVLDAIRSRARKARLFYAASSLVFGDVTESPQTEATPLAPTDPYGITKATGIQICRHYRRTHGIYAAVGILYNHESPLRSPKFLSKKVVTAAREIQRGKRDKLVLGSLSAEIDMGYAPDFVDAMHRILAVDTPDDFIIATGESHTVREFVELVFGHLGLDWTRYVEENRGVITRAPVRRVGNAAKLTASTGWRPATSFADMVRALVDAERP